MSRKPAAGRCSSDHRPPTTDHRPPTTDHRTPPTNPTTSATIPRRTAMGTLIEIQDLAKTYVRGKQKVEVLHHTCTLVSEVEHPRYSSPLPRPNSATIASTAARTSSSEPDNAIPPPQGSRTRPHARPRATG